MELRSTPKDGCHASAKDAQSACGQLVEFPLAGLQTVKAPKCVDACFIPALICEVCHSNNFTPFSIRRHDLSPGDRWPSGPMGGGMSSRGPLPAKRIEEICVGFISAPAFGPGVRGGDAGGHHRRESLSC